MDTTTIFRIMGRPWRGWFDRRKKSFMGALINPLYESLGSPVEWYAERQTRQALIVGPGETS